MTGSPQSLGLPNRRSISTCTFGSLTAWACGSEIQNLVRDYDRLERAETFLSYEDQTEAWLVIIANRLAENVLPESHFASMGRFKEALLQVEAEGLGLPLEIVKSFKAHVEGRWSLAA